MQHTPHFNNPNVSTYIIQKPCIFAAYEKNDWLVAALRDDFMGQRL
jgi:hypothetical protein